MFGAAATFLYVFRRGEWTVDGASFLRRVY